jgi:hypothetical protein
MSEVGGCHGGPSQLFRTSCGRICIPILWILCFVCYMTSGKCFFATTPCPAGLACVSGRRNPSRYGSCRYGVKALRGGLDDRPEQVRRVREGANEFLNSLLGEAMSVNRERSRATSTSRADWEDAGGAHVFDPTIRMLIFAA